ncbi:MAG: tetratricopeptide repeat protein, partial [Saprospiraceae bacterium]|nr:tetratricopeptide repeat protein [Saprospiraceae bacterium]
MLFFFCAASLGFSQGRGVSDTIRGVPDKIGANLHRAPSLQALRDKARKSHEEADYGRAIQYYDMILSARPKDSLALIGLADAAYRFTKYDRAAWAYQTLLDGNMAKDPNGLLAARLGDAFYGMGKYAEARLWYNRADAKPAASKETRELVKTGLANCTWAEEALDALQMTNIRLDTLPKGVNTRYSEYSPIWADSLLYFASYGGFPYREDEKTPERRFIQVITAEPMLDTILVRPASFNEEDRHTAYATFNRDKSVLYYAVGKNNGAHQIRFELYRRKRNALNAWGPAERLPNSINVAEHTNTQPNVGILPGETTETLFFVSDRPGGKGGKDIWFSRIENDSFAQPVNLSALNTPADDVSPFYHTFTQTLYFSSTGYRQHSLGGFDIYHSERTKTGWTTPEAMPAPINSGANDVFYSLPADCGNMAFFSSNRKGAMNFSEEDCCYDLFRAMLDRPAFVATTFHKITGDSLRGTTLRLVEMTAAGNTDLGSVEERGAWRAFKLSIEKKYMLIASKAGFVGDTIYFDSPKTVWSCAQNVNLYLRPVKVNLIASVYDCKTKEALNGAVFKFYDLVQVLPNGAWATNPAGGPLDSLVTTVETSNTKMYPLEFSHWYQLFVSKAGYTDDSVKVSTENLYRDTTFEVKLYLCQGLYLDVYVWDDITKKPLNDVQLRLLNIPGNTQISHSTGPDNNDFHTVIFYDSRYRISANKEGYSQDSLEFRTDDLPRKPFHHIRKDLYLRPLDPTLYLPIVLYFDNDEPDSRTLDTTTKKEYQQAYLPYYNRKQRYIDEYTANVTGTVYQDRRIEMD